MVHHKPGQILVWENGKPVWKDPKPLDNRLDVTLEEAKRMIFNLANQVGELQKRLAREDDWLPTAENINSLPKGMKDYIYGIETNCDPQWVIRENRLMKDLIKQLEAKIERMKE